MEIHPESVARLLFLVPLIPLVGAAVNGLFGRWLGRDNVAVIASAAVAVPFVISVGVFIALMGGEQQVLYQGYPWIHVAGLQVDVALLADQLTSVMLLVITGIGFFIHVYSIGYMAHDEGYWRYFSYLNLFVGMMLILVLGDSLVLLFVGWEGVGLCSYLLIGFWYSDVDKANAGMKAFIVNRVGDFGFLIGLFTLFALFGTLSVTGLREAAAGVDVTQTLPAGVLFGGWTVGGVITLAMLMLFMGATGKSAQIPLFVWLPDAMAGPTPVSALIHAATMVTAGVYMLVRVSFLLVLSPTTMVVIAIVGVLTALVGAFMGLFQNGIKKVLAYSTVSQLGYMFLGVGVGAFSAGVYHLFTHAFFKACLFLAAGSVMHAMGNEEDIRKMGGLAKKLPHTRWTFWISTVAITGVFMFSGFWSKDAILHQAVSAQFQLGPFWTGALPWILYALGALAALFTSIYMWRLYVLTFKGEPRTPELYAHAHESPASMTSALWVLAVGAILVSGWGISEMFHGPSFETWLHPVTATLASPGEAAHHLPAWPFLLAALAIAWAGYGIAYTLWGKQGPAADEVVKARLGPVYTASYARLWWDEAYDFLFVRPLVALSSVLWWFSDVLLIDRVLVEGSAKSYQFAARRLKPLQNGDAQRYAAVMTVGAVLVLALLVGYRAWASPTASAPTAMIEEVR